jgi:molybdate/tungstate transport system substrate-binding protein
LLNLLSRNEIRHVLPTRPRLALLATLLAACSSGSDHASATAPETLIVFEAASLATPMRAVLDTFARRTGTKVVEEHGASLELARRVTELHRVPDVILLADQEVFPQLLVPKAASWYARFARNRMVVAYTDRSRDAASMTADGWWKQLLRPDVLVGRADPVLAPAGYRALLLFQLAERFYGQPGLAARLEARTPPRLIRGNAAELAALLEAGELDYIVEYESLARAHRFRYVALPPEIDLGDPAHAADYARASVRVARGKDTVSIVGAPILYGASVPRAAPHGTVGARFLTYLLSHEGRAILQRGHVDVLAMPELVGDSVPAELRQVAKP